MRRDPDAPRGALHTLTVESALLGENLLGDPTRREVQVYVPAGRDAEGLPLLVDLVGYTGSGLAHTAWKAFAENVPERLDRLIAAGAMPPVCVAFPDCFTRLGGNQYVDSAAMGPWERYLTREMLPAVEERFGCGGDGRRGVFGKSSGGYGALVHAMRRPDVWSAAACHSGDLDFERVYAPLFPDTARALAKHDLSIEAWVRDFEKAEKHEPGQIQTLMVLAMAATYDPDPEAFLGIRLPFDLETLERDPQRWARWLAWDPLHMLEAEGHAEALRGLKALYVDCGDVDQFDLVYGARRLHRRLEGQGVPHRYDEFPDDHSGIDYRMDESLPFLARALTD